jgi:hypothetical protein
MNRNLGNLLGGVLVLLLVSDIGNASPLAVTQGRAAQRAGTKLVDVYYDISGGTPPYTVTLQGSLDGGATWTLPVTTVSGNVGTVSTPGSNRLITWDAGADWAGQISENVKFKVTAADTPDLQHGLVAYYSFDGNANDASGNGNHGTLFGGIVFVGGKTGLAAQFDGSDDYITAANHPSLDLTASFTLLAWIYQDGAISSGYRIIDKCPAGIAGGWTFDTYGNNSGGHRLRLQAVGPNGNNVVGTTDYTLSSWHHVVATVSGTTGNVYIDGQLDGTGIVGQIPSNSLDIRIGRATPSFVSPGNQEFFRGRMDNIRIYNRALSLVEIQQIYQIERGS